LSKKKLKQILKQRKNSFKQKILIKLLKLFYHKVI